MRAYTVDVRGVCDDSAQQMPDRFGGRGMVGWPEAHKRESFVERGG